MNQSPLWQFDQDFRQRHQLDDLIGIDEAGRGALAGPVVAAAVRLPAQFAHPEINDSKQLSEAKREALFDWILAQPGVEAKIVAASHKVIDDVNILQATLIAMQIAGKQLQKPDSFFLVDGNRMPAKLDVGEALVKGDAHSLTIATASILAKVARDREMRYWHGKYPIYNFGKNKGYGSKEHRNALKINGITPIHRRTFLRKILAAAEQLPLIS